MHRCGPIADSGEWQDWLVDECDQEESLAESEELAMRRKYLGHALDTLNERERRISRLAVCATILRHLKISRLSSVYPASASGKSRSGP